MTPRAPAGRSDPDQRRLWIVAVVALAAGAWLLLGPSAQPACGALPSQGDSVHVIYTSNGSPYLNYQSLALHGTFRMAQRMRPGGDKMVALTRILHRTEDDELSPFIPTFRAIPLHPECDGGRPVLCRYPVADRANAVRQFLAAADLNPALIKAPWLLLIESDFLFARPVAAPGTAEDPGVRSQAFFYTYIFPEAKIMKGVMPRYYPPGMGPLSDIPRSGPSPVMARLPEWRRVVPRWEGLTAQIESDEEFVRKVLWVREMYAFSVAAAVERLDLEIQHSHNGTLMIQPPVDLRLGNASLIHYTWGPKLVFVSNGSVHWRFEKREHAFENLDDLTFMRLPPPYAEGRYKTPSSRVGPQGAPTTRQDYDLILFEVQLFNAGLREVGGKQWKAVLGAELAARRGGGG